MVSLWAGLVAVVNFLTLTPVSDPIIEQQPFAVSTAIVSPPIASTLAGKHEPPEPFLPPSAPPDSNFTCEYPEMRDYKPCSTYGDRSCWLRSSNPKDPEYNINTNYERYFPKGRTRKIYLEVHHKTIEPDGKPRQAMVVNGTYPGPWIQACWGDWLEITVKNRLETNGTTIHWHGIRQLNTTASDGVNAITQCPIAPGETFTYKFRAMQYGTSWYHSHYSLQYGEGVLGAMTIHGPSSADYDEALEPVLMTDWAHTSWFKMWWDRMTSTAEDKPNITIDNILVGGKGSWPADHPSKEFKLKFERGKRYLLRLINTSVDTTFIFSIDNHKIQVIGADFVPIVPYMTDHVVVGIGQRYHIIVSANPIDGNDAANYWIRTIPAKGCNPIKKEIDHRTGIVIYDEDAADPVDFPITFDLTCRDEPYDKLVPVLPWTVGAPTNIAADSQFDIGFDNLTSSSKWPGNLTTPRWNMYSNTMWLDFSNITLAQDLAAPQKAFDAHSVVVKHDSTLEDQWVYLLVSGTGIPRTGRRYIPTEHPIHLHGHDFAILQQSSQNYSLGGLDLKKDNPPRRDVALMPASGFLVLAFKADNPGVWLMHCHIATHASGGLAMQIVENGPQIELLAFDQDQMRETCKKWDQWAGDSKNHFLQDDSGI